MSRTNWNPDAPSKVTILDAEEAPVRPVAVAQPQQQQQWGGAAPLTGGIPKGGVFHA